MGLTRWFETILKSHWVEKERERKGDIPPKGLAAGAPKGLAGAPKGAGAGAAPNGDGVGAPAFTT